MRCPKLKICDIGMYSQFKNLSTMLPIFLKNPPIFFCTFFVVSFSSFSSPFNSSLVSSSTSPFSFSSFSLNFSDFLLCFSSSFYLCLSSLAISFSLSFFSLSHYFCTFFLPFSASWTKSLSPYNYTNWFAIEIISLITICS